MQGIKRFIGLTRLNKASTVFRRSVLQPNPCIKRLYTSENVPPSSTTPQSPEHLMEPESLRRELSEKEKQLKELKDSYLLVLADMENLRQRTKRDVESASQFAIQRFCKDIIPVADILEMALNSVEGKQPNEEAQADVDAEATPNPGERSLRQLKDLVEGLAMTKDELLKIFGKHGVTVIEPLHQKFDPNLHNALFEVPSAGVDAGIVVSVQKKGYMLHHRILRPADVGVSRKPN